MVVTLEIAKPHGFLIWNGKQKAIATDKLIELADNMLLISNGEAFGNITLEPKYATLKSQVFHTKEWQAEHCIWPDEQRRLWPDSDTFYVYRIREFEPFEKPKQFENGKIIEYEPSKADLAVIYRAKRLPRVITLNEQAVVLVNGEFEIADTANTDELKVALNATYSEEKFKSTGDGELALYQLALVRNPNPIIKKKKTLSKKQVDDMPWEKVRNHSGCNEGEIAVVKVDGDELEGCHDSEESANAQLAALNIAESETNALEDEAKQDENVSIESIDQRMDRISTQFDAQFDPDRDESLWIVHTFDDHLIAQFQGDFFKIKYIETMDRFVFDPRVNWTQVDLSFEPRLQRSWTDKLKQAAKTVLDYVSRDEPSTGSETEEDSFMIDFNTPFGAGVKTVNGELWHFTWSTNAFEDREGEIFSTKALETFVKESEEKGFKGTFDFWHIPGTDFAIKEWKGVVGRFLIESGPYLKNEAGRSAAKFFKQFPNGHDEFAPEGWGASPEFRFLPEDREDRIFDNIWITRTSTLPRFAAANVHTEGKQIMALTDQQKEAATAIFGEGFVNNLQQEAEEKTAELEGEGVAHKEVETQEESENTEEVVTPDATIDIDMDELAEAILGKLEVKLEPFQEAIVVLGENVKATQDRLEKLEKDKEIIEKVEMPRFALNLVKRASEADETLVTEDDKELAEAGNTFNALKPGESAAGHFFTSK